MSLRRSPRGLVATVTLNPAVDQAFVVGQLRLGDVNRCQVEAIDPGGKGLNASRVVHRLGRETIALGFVGGVTGQMIRQGLDAEGVPHDFDEVPSPTRLNVMVRETDPGRRTRIYAPGARVDPADLTRLRARLAALPPWSVVVLAGSLPPGLPDTIYRDLAAELRARRLPVIVDAAGQTLARALEARPTLVKPNAEEAAELIGEPIRDEAEALAAALRLRARGAEWVVISRGEEGAVALGPDGCWSAHPPCIAARSTVGSGDSMVAGLAVGLLEDWPFTEWLRLGSAAGAATAMTPGTQLGRRRDIVRLRPLVRVAVLSDANPTTAAA